MDHLYLLSLALGPAFILVHLLWLRDRFREPLGNVALYLLLGALSVVPAVLLELVLVPLWPALLGGFAGTAVTAFLGVALVEEGCKLGFLRLRARGDKHLDEPFDWVVYAVSVSLGFAAVENVAYVYQHGADVGWLRAFTAVPGHALFGTLMGARLAERLGGARRGAAGFAALVEPVLWHGAYDAPLLLAEQGLHGGLAVVLWLATMALLWRHAAGHLRRLRTLQTFPPPPLLAPASIPALVLRRRDG